MLIEEKVKEAREQLAKYEKELDDDVQQRAWTKQLNNSVGGDIDDGNLLAEHGWDIIRGSAQKDRLINDKRYELSVGIATYIETKLIDFLPVKKGGNNYFDVLELLKNEGIKEDVFQMIHWFFTHAKHKDKSSEEKFMEKWNAQYKNTDIFDFFMLISENFEILNNKYGRPTKISF